MFAYLFLAIAVSAPDFDVQTSTGETLTGPILELSAERVVIGQVISGQPDKNRVLGVSEVLSIAPHAAPAPFESQHDHPDIQIELADSTLLAAATFAMDNSEASISLAGGGSLKLPSRSMVAVRFKEQPPEVAAQWKRLAAAPRSADLLVVRKKGSLDFVEGIVVETSDQTVKFKTDGETLDVKRSRVEGLLFAISGAAISEGFCTVTDTAGSRISIRESTAGPDGLRIISPAGVDLVVAWDRLAAISFPSQYVSDWEPERQEWTPYFGQADSSESLAQFFRTRCDAAVGGGELRLGGKSYSKGLSVPSRTELVYRLPDGKFTRFHAIAGIDDRVRPLGNVRLAIFGDDRMLFEAEISGTGEPLAVEADLKGVKRLKILVDFAGDLDVADFLDLCEPRVF